MAVKVGIITPYAPSLLLVGDDIGKVFSQSGFEVKRYRYLVDWGTAKSQFDRSLIFTPFDPVSMHSWFLMHLHHLRMGIPTVTYVTTEGQPDERLISNWVKTDVEVYACSNFVKQMVESVGVKILGVVPHGVDFQYVSQFTTQPRPKTEGVVFGTVASNLSRKGLKNLSEIARQVPEATFRVFSTPHAKRHFEGLQNVELVPKFGGLPREKLLIEMSQFDYYLCTSHSEGFCLPVLEAMALGKPVIYPDFSPLNEFANVQANFSVPVTGIETKENIDKLASGIRFLFHYYDVDKMVEAVKTAIKLRIENFDEYLFRSKQVMERAREFDIFTTYRKFVELLK
ncbi:MAG: glycosyltransferase [Candidatus Caldarchaeum sp.]